MRTAAGHHTQFANRLISVTRTMKPKVSDAAKEIDRQLVNGRTVMAYKELAGNAARGRSSPNNRRTKPRIVGKGNGNGKAKTQIQPQHRKKKNGPTFSPKSKSSGLRSKSC